MSSLRTGILFLIRFKLGQNWDVSCRLDGSRASFLVPGYSPSKSVSPSPFGLDFGALDVGLGLDNISLTYSDLLSFVS